MAWLSLIFAGLCEMTGVMMINKLHRDRSVVAFIQMSVSFTLSFVLLAVAMRTLPMGTAYAIWTGIGAAGGAIMGMLWFGESKDLRRLLCIALVLGATIGLKLVS